MGLVEILVDRGRAKGFALIAVLWLLALLSLIAASLAQQMKLDATVAQNILHRANTRIAAQAGVQRAILDLWTPPDAQKFRTDGTVYTWRFANSKVYVSIKDESTKLDLNQAPVEPLVALFQSLGLQPDEAESVAEAIADFRDPDDLMHPRGAEQHQYQVAGLAWGPKNAPFDEVQELHQVFGVTQEIYEQIAPSLTTHNAEDATILFDGSRGSAFSIRSEAKSFNGGDFVREAIVRQRLGNLVIVSWQEGQGSRHLDIASKYDPQ